MTLQERRKAKGLTLEKLARESGVSMGTLSEIETGKRRVTDRTARKIAAALGVRSYWKLITH